MTSDTKTAKLSSEGGIASYPKKRIMVAGIGNIFLKDDGFGNEVITQIKQKEFFKNIEVHDFGVGGLKLAYDLMKGYDGLVLIDASPRGDEPGTLYVIEPNEKEIDGELEEGTFVDPHGGDAATVLKFVKALKAWPGKVVIVGCEPAEVDAFSVGLSEPVAAAVHKAIDVVEEIINEMNHQ